ncbi:MULTISPECIES: hypothetical protein [unclassified Afipia]|nr:MULTISPECIES: hypothetical protein [unclassified Afipia]
MAAFPEGDFNAGACKYSGSENASLGRLKSADSGGLNGSHVFRV